MNWGNLSSLKNHSWCFAQSCPSQEQEFNVAGQQGHKPDMILIVDSDSYDNEKKVQYQKKKYDIYKTYMRSDGFHRIIL